MSAVTRGDECPGAPKRSSAPRSARASATRGEGGVATDRPQSRRFNIINPANRKCRRGDRTVDRPACTTGRERTVVSANTGSILAGAGRRWSAAIPNRRQGCRANRETWGPVRAASSRLTALTITGHFYVRCTGGKRERSPLTRNSSSFSPFHNSTGLRCRGPPPWLSGMRRGRCAPTWSRWPANTWSEKTPVAWVRGLHQAIS